MIPEQIHRDRIEARLSRVARRGEMGNYHYLIISTKFAFGTMKTFLEVDSGDGSTTM